MQSPAWTLRALACASIYLIAEVFDALFSCPTNTRLGASVYYGAAALVNFCSIVLFSRIISGKVSLDLQRLGLCAMVFNFLSWISYLAQQSPVVFNTTIAAVTYAQYLRILWTDDGDDDVGARRVSVFHRADLCSPSLYPREAER